MARESICMSCRHAKMFRSNILKETFLVCTKNMLPESFVQLNTMQECKAFRPKCRACTFNKKIGPFYRCIIGEPKTKCNVFMPKEGYNDIEELDDQYMLEYLRETKED